LNPGSNAALPGESDLIAQYLLLLDSVDQIDDLLTTDRDRANIILRLDGNGSSEIIRLSEQITEWWKANGADGYTATVTGIMYEFGRAEEEIAYGQIKGLAFALAAISIVLVVIFRRLRVVVAALIPNVIPLLIAYGFMGIFSVPLDAATVCFGSLALGIAVDDTIHVTNGYVTRIDDGESKSAAVAASLRSAFPALVFSTAAISVGFSVVGLSTFTLIRNLGLITSAMVVICLLADITLLPALFEGGTRRDSRLNSAASH
jgi:predicted RND superfamily exporter protein